MGAWRSYFKSMLVCHLWTYVIGAVRQETHHCAYIQWWPISIVLLYYQKVGRQTAGSVDEEEGPVMRHSYVCRCMCDIHVSAVVLLWHCVMFSDSAFHETSAWMLHMERLISQAVEAVTSSLSQTSSENVSPIKVPIPHHPLHLLGSYGGGKRSDDCFLLPRWEPLYIVQKFTFNRGASQYGWNHYNIWTKFHWYDLVKYNYKFGRKIFAFNLTRYWPCYLLSCTSINNQLISWFLLFKLVMGRFAESGMFRW